MPVLRLGLKMIVLAVLMLSLAGCSQSGSDRQEPPDDALPVLSTNAGFARYNEPSVDVKPSVQPYQTAKELANVSNYDRFNFSPAAEELLVKNNFVVVPGQHREFFALYEGNRYELLPNFVTTDAMMHNYHLYFSHLLKSLEKEELSPELKSLTSAMLVQSLDQHKSLQGTPWENAALRNVAFFAVAARLLDDKAEVPAMVRPAVERELQLITEHRQVMVPSPVMNIGNSASSMLETCNEDYTQYIPRGHYTTSENLKAYFKAMMWYGRMTFRTGSEDETRSAVLMTLLLGEEANNRSWNRIYEPTNFFVGKSDDLGFWQYQELLGQTYGENYTLKAVTEDAARWQTFVAEVKKLEPPAINSIPIFDESLQPDREKVIKGFRFMGQRYTLDANIFQRLVYREVKENPEGQRRMLPKSLDIPAAMGSEEAYAVLKAMGETKYEKYPENMTRLKEHISGMDPGTWAENLYWSWLYTLKPLTEPKGEGYPSFMTNRAWTLKQLQTYLGSWTELKHDTILYAKPVYAEAGGGGEDLDDRGYVEPNPYVFARLAALTRMTIDGLEERGLLDERDRDCLVRMEDLAMAMKTIAEKELAEQQLSDQEYDLIRGFGAQLEHFWLEALRDEGVDHHSACYTNPAALVADVANTPEGMTLEEGTGWINEIYVVVPIDGSLRIAKGGVYSYYEFPWPSTDRLTDQKWRQMLEAGEAPKPPSWTEVFTAW